MSDSEEKQSQSQPKRRGPLRLEALIPLGIVIALIAAYMWFFLDGHVRRAVEYAATQANGAEVNIGSAKTDWRSLTLILRDIEATDRSQPSHNRFELDEIRISFLWDAVLRARWVTDDVAFLGVRPGGKRQRPGRVVHDGLYVETHVLIQQLRDEAIARIKASRLADLATFVKGLDPRQALKDVKNLQTLTFLRESQAKLEGLQTSWKAELKALPDENEIAALKSRFQALPSNIDNPLEAAKAVQDGKQLLADVKALRQKVEGPVKTLKQRTLEPLTAFETGLQEALSADRQALAARLKIPSLDVQDLSRELFGPQLLGYVADARRLLRMAEQWMPPAAQEDARVTVSALPGWAKGRDFHFASGPRYPKFWLRQGRLAGPLRDGLAVWKGALGDWSDVPSWIKEPARLSAAGDMPGLKIKDFKAEVTFDHRQTPARQSIRLDIGRMPLTDVFFRKTESLGFGVAQAAAQAQATLSHQSGRLSLDVSTAFSEAAFHIEATSSLVQKLLKEAVDGLDVLKVRMQVDLPGGLRVESNLARALATNLRRQVESKVNLARAEIEKTLRAQVDKPRQLFEAQRKRFEREVQQVSERLDQESQRLRDEVEARLRKLEEAAKGRAEDQAQDALDRLKKRIKF